MTRSPGNPATDSASQSSAAAAPDRNSERLWRVLVGAAIALYALTYLGVVAARIGYAYELEWMEGGLLTHAARISDGSGIYVAPSIDFIPYLYTPLYLPRPQGITAAEA